MRNFWVYLFKIIGGLILIMFFLDIAYTIIYRTSSPRNKIQTIFYLENKHFDLAFFGSSRTENNIDCEVIEKITGKSCINLGMAGASMGDIYYLMRIAQKNNLQFDQVYLQLDYNYNQESSETTLYFKGILAPYQKSLFIKSYNSDFTYENKMNLFPFYRYMKNDKVIGFRESLFSFFNKKPGFDPQNGFLPQQGNGFLIAGNLPSNIINNNMALEKMKTIFQNNSQFKFFTAPYCHLVKNREFVDLLKEKEPSLYNFVGIFDTNPEYFANCGHLNEEGAKEFSKILGNIISK